MVGSKPLMIRLAAALVCLGAIGGGAASAASPDEEAMREECAAVSERVAALLRAGQTARARVLEPTMTRCLTANREQLQRESEDVLRRLQRPAK